MQTKPFINNQFSNEFPLSSVWHHLPHLGNYYIIQYIQDTQIYGSQSNRISNLLSQTDIHSNTDTCCESSLPYYHKCNYSTFPCRFLPSRMEPFAAVAINETPIRPQNTAMSASLLYKMEHMIRILQDAMLFVCCLNACIRPSYTRPTQLSRHKIRRHSQTKKMVEGSKIEIWLPRTIQSFYMANMQSILCKFTQNIASKCHHFISMACKPTDRFRFTINLQ